MVAFVSSHRISVFIISFLGILLNAFLLFLLVKKPLKRMQSYRKVLLQNSIMNLFHSVVIFFVSPLIIGYKGYTFAFVNNIFFKDIAKEWLTVYMTFWLFSYISLVCSLPVQFIYRYLLI